MMLQIKKKENPFFLPTSKRNSVPLIAPPRGLENSPCDWIYRLFLLLRFLDCLFLTSCICNILAVDVFVFAAGPLLLFVLDFHVLLKLAWFHRCSTFSRKCFRPCYHVSHKRLWSWIHFYISTFTYVIWQTFLRGFTDRFLLHVVVSWPESSYCDLHVSFIIILTHY